MREDGIEPPFPSSGQQGLLMDRGSLGDLRGLPNSGVPCSCKPSPSSQIPVFTSSRNMVTRIDFRLKREHERMILYSVYIIV